VLELVIRYVNFQIKMLFNFDFGAVVISEDSCNMCTCSGNGTQELAVHDLISLVSFRFFLFDLISTSRLSLSLIGYPCVFLGLVCLAGRLYYEFWVRNGHAALVEGELEMFVMAGLPDLSVCAATGIDRDCTKAIALDLCI